MNRYVYFRKEFSCCCEDFSDVKIFISADTRYRLYVNGSYVRSGPVQSQPYNAYYDEQNIGQWLNREKNTLAFEVFYGGHIQDTRGGLLFEVQDSDGKILAASDASVKALPAVAWSCHTYGQPHINRFAPYQERLDARLIPEGWKQTGFYDSDWSSAAVIGGRNNMDTPPAAGPWTKLSARPVPDMREYPVAPVIVREEESLYIQNRFRAEDLSISLSQPGTALRYSSILHKGEQNREELEVLCSMDEKYGGVYNPSVLLDFGKEVTAYFELALDGHAGQTVEIGYAERLIDGYFNNALECQFADCYILREGRQVFRSFNWRGYRYVRLIFKECHQPLRVIGCRGLVTEYPFEAKGKFKTEDRELEQVFHICQDTIKLCCNEAIVDTPWREQSQWMGDVAAVTLGGIYSSFGETVLAKKFLTQSAANQLPAGFVSNTTNTTADHYQNCMIDYNFWWIIALWEYYLYTGDEELLNRLYPTVCRMILAADDFRDTYGMLNRVPFIVFIDWAANDRRGECCALNALYYGTLSAFGKMARKKQDDYMASYAEQAMHLIKENFAARFYDEKTGLFVDAVIEEEKSEVISEAANMLAIYFDLAEDSQRRSAISRIIEKKDIEFVEACPFLALYTLRALAKSERMDLALLMIREKWYKRFVQKGLTSTAEEWSMNGSYRNGDFLPIIRSLSHAWSAGPAEFLMKDLNGIQVLEPGGKKVLVTPFKLECDYEIRYPLPSGYIDIEQKNGEIRCCASEGIELVFSEEQKG